MKVAARMHRLRSLLAIRTGASAVVFRGHIHKLHLQFPYDHSQGSRQFWRRDLPRLKYWNPAMPMIVNITRDPADRYEALTVYYESDDPPALPGHVENNDPNSTALSNSGTTNTVSDNWDNFYSSLHGKSPAPPPAPKEKKVVINTRSMNAATILDQLLQLTGAMSVDPTPADIKIRREVADKEAMLKYNRALAKQARAAAAEQKRIMEKAQLEAAAIKADS